MIKSELIHILTARNPHLYHRDAEKVVDAVFDEIVRGLEEGRRIELRGFGTFSVRHRAPRSGRNPRNGKFVFVQEKWVPFFKTARDLQKRLNPAAGEVEKEPTRKRSSDEAV